MNEITLTKREISRNRRSVKRVAILEKELFKKKTVLDENITNYLLGRKYLSKAKLHKLLIKIEKKNREVKNEK